MKTNDEIRRDNARKLRDSVGGNNSFATFIDRESTQVSRIIGKNPTKKIGDDLARHIEKCFSLAVGWLDSEHQVSNAVNINNISETNLEIRMVPLISWVQSGSWTSIQDPEKDDNFLQQYPCPVPCSEMTYILRVVGDSMIEEYSPGEMIFVDPQVEASHGDDVIALLPDSGEATFKRLIEDSGKKYLKALNKNWPEQYIQVNSRCSIIGTVIFSGKTRR
ncbi:LexA family protein [Symbiopectobacterium purcellii]|uniref:LexA family protein n=1 Tax=Symbiopectobacterium purcellii TaxID=2871826 RepID=UPI003F871656